VARDRVASFTRPATRGGMIEDPILAALARLEAGQSDISGRLERLESGQSDISGRLERLESGQSDISGRLERLETGQSDVSSRLERLEAGQRDMSGRLAQLEAGQRGLQDEVQMLGRAVAAIVEGQTTLRVDVMARMERFENRLTEIGDDIAVTMNNAARVEEAGDHARKYIRSITEQLSIMQRQIGRLQTNVAQLRGDP